MLVNYHIGHFVLGSLCVGDLVRLGLKNVRVAGFSLQPGNYSNPTAPNLQHTANQERHDQCGKQHHSRELLMMDIVMLETCSAYKKYNKISSDINLAFLFFSFHTYVYYLRIIIQDLLTFTMLYTRESPMKR